MIKQEIWTAGYKANAKRKLKYREGCAKAFSDFEYIVYPKLEVSIRGKMGYNKAKKQLDFIWLAMRPSRTSLWY